MNKGVTLIESGIDVSALMEELEAHPELWNEYDYRSSTPGTPHGAVSDIWLRYNDINAYAANDRESMMHEHDSVWYEAIDKLPGFKALTNILMSQLQGERLGGVLIGKLPPGEMIAPHIDYLWHSEYYTKYHLVLQGEDSIIFSGYDKIRTKPGDLFRLDSSQTHGVINLGKDDRISVCVCIRHDNGQRVRKL